MLRKILFLLFLLPMNSVQGQQILSGRILEINEGKELSIPGASIGLLDGSIYAVSDSAGFFSIPFSGDFPQVIIAGFIGYVSDTITFTSTERVKIFLKKSIDLKEVDVNARKQAVTVSTIKPINTEHISERELLKAACCNLSEAFETNPSVNVAYKDAVTGVKEIQLLGLGGIYVQMLSENIPDMRGLAGIYGLTYIPGPWIESIQLSKGSGSVLNGYESVTGQINVEYKKPLEKEVPRYYFNLFGDGFGGVEANVIFKRKLNPKWGTMLMLHGRSMNKETDRNDDGFMDIPGNNTINIYNRWQYHSNNKLEGQVAVKFLWDEMKGGQMNDLSVSPLYKTFVSTKRGEINGKLGFINAKKPYRSIGNIFQATIHDMQSGFGLRTYNARESSIYFQSIYQNILWKTNHNYKAGISYRFNLLEQQFESMPSRIEENIPGVFFEYTYNYIDKLTLIFGVREDLQDDNKFIFTPRFHGKYNFTENFIVRFNAGKNYRRPYLIADHLSVLASSRHINVNEEILPERAWNYGINLTKRFNIGEHEQTLSADLYRTEFINQLVLDAYTDSTQISYYNLNGESYSNSFQIAFNSEIIDLLTVRLAYKMEDVRSTFNGIVEEQPLVSRNRLFGTISYSTPNEHWKFDYTVSWEGRKKLQNVYEDSNYGSSSYSPDFYIMNFQATKVFRKFEVYAGAENILDYRQMNPIIHPEDPFGNSFDATNIWGPIAGRRVYAGVRMSIR